MYLRLRSDGDDTENQQLMTSNTIIKKATHEVQLSILTLKRHLNEQQFLMIVCIIVSFIAAFAAVGLKMFVFYLEHFFFNTIRGHNFLWYPPLLALVGLGVSSWLIFRVFKKKFLKGNDKIVYAIAKNHSELPFSLMYSPLITSGITAGCGGSAGLESPIVAASAAIGSNIGYAALLPQRDKTLMIACGIASGISAAFSAPIAGVLFAIEVLMVDISVASFIPLLIAGAIGSILAQVILGSEILLSFVNMQDFKYSNIHYYIVLGILSGLIALYYIHVYEWIERIFSKINNTVQRWLIGSVLLSVMILAFPPLYGEGYEFIKHLADTGHFPDNAHSFLLVHTGSEWLTVLFVLGILLAKVFASAFTIMGGGNGGNFAPSLFIGALIGFVLGKFCLLSGHDIPLANFIVAGMAGMLSGVYFAPLTAIFLSAELTNGYSLFIPLMIVSAISFFVVKYFQPLSMEMRKLKETTSLNPIDKDLFLLSRMELASFVRADISSFSESESLENVLSKVRFANDSIYFIVDKERKYLGVVLFSDIKKMYFEPDSIKGKISIANYMSRIKPLLLSDTITAALDRFDKEKVFNSELPIVDQNNQLLGIVRRENILTEYRKEMIGSFH